MVFKEKYIVLEQNKFVNGIYKIIPIRYEDRMLIMKWRNEQIIYLRQQNLLTKENQEIYFNNVIASLFEDSNPSQLLFSYFKNNEMIGYGGLVHIDWKNLNAEISFLLNTGLNQEDSYKELSVVFFQLIELLAKNIKFHKIYTYGYDLFEYRFYPLIKNGYSLEVLLKRHIMIEDNLHDIRIYSKIL